MKSEKRDLDIFSLSFLDIVSCGFGAVLMLVLIFHTSYFTADGDGRNITDVLKNLFSIERNLSEKNKHLAALNEELSSLRDASDELTNTRKMLARQVASGQREADKITRDIKGLELVQSSLHRASISPDTAKKRDDMSGGIPVDSDYVIFIIDTSGSMQQIWGKVMAVMADVLNIHPEVKGFQVLSDNGAYLLSGYRRKWIPDTPAKRKGVLKLLKGWATSSNSSPVEGLEVALKTYARSGKNISLYIFGDDYTGSSYGPVLEALDKLNRNPRTGKPLVKVHGIGFITATSTNRFSVLMREVAKRNRGTFLALPIQ